MGYLKILIVWELLLYAKLAIKLKVAQNIKYVKILILNKMTYPNKSCI
jgi:hypothetical protein